jgi:hypothetical protein
MVQLRKGQGRSWSSPARRGDDDVFAEFNVEKRPPMAGDGEGRLLASEEVVRCSGWCGFAWKGESGRGFVGL